MNLTLKIDTEKAAKQYKVVVIDCWSVLGDHVVPPEPKVVATYDADVIEKVADSDAITLLLKNS